MSTKSANGKSVGVSILVLLLVCLIPRGASADETKLRDTACRLFDSRMIGGYNAGSKITSATIETTDADLLDTVAFTHGGRSYNSQGGEVGCWVPLVASGAILSVIVYTPDSLGNATIWPVGFAQPLATSINSSGASTEVTGFPVTLGAGGELNLASTITGAHYIIDLAGSIMKCVPEDTFSFGYSESSSSISVPETGDINLMKYYYPGASIWVGGQASQSGRYTITGTGISNGRQRLYVTPTPQAATDQGLEVHLLPGACSPRETLLDGFSN